MDHSLCALYLLHKGLNSHSETFNASDINIIYKVTSVFEYRSSSCHKYGDLSLDLFDGILPLPDDVPSCWLDMTKTYIHPSTSLHYYWGCGDSPCWKSFQAYMVCEYQLAIAWFHVLKVKVYDGYFRNVFGPQAPMEMMRKWLITTVTVWSNNKLLIINVCAVLVHRVGEWLLTSNSHGWWGFSFVQTCPLGLQRPPVDFMKSLMRVCWRDFLNVWHWTIAISTTCNVRRRIWRTVPLWSGYWDKHNWSWAVSPIYQQLKAEFYSATTQLTKQPHASNKLTRQSCFNRISVVLYSHQQCWDLAMHGLSLLRSPNISILD